MSSPSKAWLNEYSDKEKNGASSKATICTCDLLILCGLVLGYVVELPFMASAAVGPCVRARASCNPSEK
jgi:hypothetical protein